ncbi:hypothetical protein DI09_208p30 [Mitosporidium daphniae]|uniref:Uncharacterized protein n=1 Tax=Mitosporidium daphniae TaxID=1485682 RepID=A0A098VT07_9MICR|nr:uncharacterized protein DI09_208p30 [Mitosporidium daphniae]KGG52120.1 hypothetical protein DI09_208p30 [Mitosporidium daphniae]|eukprot:XP_013238556.1 uncharacterized protein DI09_208p30 [Mitosporidium daphniae]
MIFEIKFSGATKEHDSIFPSGSLVRALEMLPGCILLSTEDSSIIGGNSDLSALIDIALVGQRVRNFAFHWPVLSQLS